ncbi:hypothetical protein EV175_005378 [Coemansia sp. RSA 1933]|nr:hypothetical protein EV175_005378 [Coemansia sp. RSA 1933]
MSSQVEDFSSLARTLCSNPHRTVLLKNAFQYQNELTKMGLGSPKSTNIDMTLFSLGGLRARADDLQPLNDPFLTDNIFKTPKKRCRGLLSWSALPLLEPTTTHRRKSGEKTHHHTEGVSHLWDISRHIRARNRRRSILGTKLSMSSMRRRRPRMAACGEHTRSISDPTSAINSVSPRTAAAEIAAAASRPSEYIGSVGSSHGRCCKSYRNTSCGLSACRSSESLHMCKRASGVCRRVREAAYRQVHAFPRLNENASTSTIFTDHLLAAPFPSPPAPAYCADSVGSSASTLRGMPGHLGPAYPLASSADTYPRIRPSTPYISVSALRLISNNHSDSFHSSASSVREPAPALLKPGKALRTQRCLSMPCGPSGTDDARNIRTMDVRIAAASVRDIPRCLVAVVPYEITSPYTKFSAVKNSLEIRQPALCSRGCHKQNHCRSLSPRSSTSNADGSGWILPMAIGILRRMALCGGKRSEDKQ